MENNFTIFDPITKRGQTFQSRIVMTALTRCRADPADGCPTDLHVQYYADRAEGTGFIISEAAAISSETNIFKGAACIYTEEQTKAWRKVTDAVHEKGAKIYCQLYHGGRVCPPEVTGVDSIGPSAIRNREPFKAGPKFIDCSEPLEATEEQLEKIKEQYIRAAELAREAGFDGVQLHAANGYLIDEFLRTSSNKRTDKYGGSVDNRCLFPLEVIDSLLTVWQANEIGIKVSPVGCFNDMNDDNPEETFSFLLRELEKRELLFVEIMESGKFKPCTAFYDCVEEQQIVNVCSVLRPSFEGIIVANNGMTAEKGNKKITDAECDMVSFGKLFISNPDLVHRMKNDLPFNETDRDTWQAAGDKGYNTYQKAA